MTPDSNGRSYPYSSNRVLVNVIVAVLSLILALTLLSSDTILLLYYLAASSVFTIITLFLKRYLYRKVIAADSEHESEAENDKRSFWRTLLTTFLLLFAFIAAPLLLAGFLSGEIWFVIMVSFTTGIGISEIILVAQVRVPQSNSAN